jgi:hypothetical protein
MVWMVGAIGHPHLMYARLALRSTRLSRLPAPIVFDGLVKVFKGGDGGRA